MADDRIIVALDVHSLEDLKKLVETLGDRVSFISRDGTVLQCRSRCGAVFEGSGKTRFPRFESTRHSQYRRAEYSRFDPSRR